MREMPACVLHHHKKSNEWGTVYEACHGCEFVVSVGGKNSCVKISVAEKVPFGLRQSLNIRPSMMPRAITSSLYSADDRALTTTDLGAQAIC